MSVDTTNLDNAMKILRAVDLHEASFEITDDGDRYNRLMRDCFDEVFENDPMKQIYMWSLDRYWNETIDICEEILRNS